MDLACIKDGTQLWNLDAQQLTKQHSRNLLTPHHTKEHHKTARPNQLLSQPHAYTTLHSTVCISLHHTTTTNITHQTEPHDSTNELRAHTPLQCTTSG